MWCIHALRKGNWSSLFEQPISNIACMLDPSFATLMIFFAVFDMQVPRFLWRKSEISSRWVAMISSLLASNFRILLQHSVKYLPGHLVGMWRVILVSQLSAHCREGMWGMLWFGILFLFQLDNPVTVSTSPNSCLRLSLHSNPRLSPVLPTTFLFGSKHLTVT